jgi:hypothetical protein
MKKPRASIFDEIVDLDVGGFTANERRDTKAPAMEQLKAVAEAANFPSREASGASSRITREHHPRVYRTGRNVQFNAKVSQETFDAIYAVTDAHPGWVLGYTLERAMAALQRELDNSK